MKKRQTSIWGNWKAPATKNFFEYGLENNDNVNENWDNNNNINNNTNNNFNEKDNVMDFYDHTYYNHMDGNGNGSGSSKKSREMDEEKSVKMEKEIRKLEDEIMKNKHLFEAERIKVTRNNLNSVLESCGKSDAVIEMLEKICKIKTERYVEKMKKKLESEKKYVEKNRKVLEKKVKTFLEMEKKKKEDNFIINEETVFTPLLQKCSDSFEVIFSFLSGIELFTKIIPTCSFFLNIIPKVLLSFKINGDVFFYYPMDELLNGMKIRDLHITDTSADGDLKCFKKISKILLDNKQYLETLKIKTAILFKSGFLSRLNKCKNLKRLFIRILSSNFVIKELYLPKLESICFDLGRNSLRNSGFFGGNHFNNHQIFKSENIGKLLSCFLKSPNLCEVSIINSNESNLGGEELFFDSILKQIFDNIEKYKSVIIPVNLDFTKFKEEYSTQIFSSSNLKNLKFEISSEENDRYGYETRVIIDEEKSEYSSTFSKFLQNIKDYTEKNKAPLINFSFLIKENTVLDSFLLEEMIKIPFSSFFFESNIILKCKEEVTSYQRKRTLDHFLKDMVGLNTINLKSITVDNKDFITLIRKLIISPSCKLENAIIKSQSCSSFVKAFDSLFPCLIHSKVNIKEITFMVNYLDSKESFFTQLFMEMIKAILSSTSKLKKIVFKGLVLPSSRYDFHTEKNTVSDIFPSKEELIEFLGLIKKNQNKIEVVIADKVYLNNIKRLNKKDEKLIWYL